MKLLKNLLDRFQSKMEKRLLGDREYTLPSPVIEYLLNQATSEEEVLKILATREKR